MTKLEIKTTDQIKEVRDTFARQILEDRRKWVSVEDLIGDYEEMERNVLDEIAVCDTKNTENAKQSKIIYALWLMQIQKRLKRLKEQDDE